MAKKLKVAQVKCIEETTEPGSDDPYIVAFVGKKKTGQADSVLTVGPSPWRNMSSGAVRDTDMTITDYNPDHFYLVALVELDVNKDVDAATRKSIKDWVSPFYRAYAVDGASNQQIATNMKSQLDVALDSYLDNDDRVGATKHLQFASPPATKTFRYIGDGGDYKFWFKVTAS
ncbi:MAG TPA: hypothetical protein VF715_19085 [Thermoleophilaceae bacterium]